MGVGTRAARVRTPKGVAGSYLSVKPGGLDRGMNVMARGAGMVSQVFGLVQLTSLLGAGANALAGKNKTGPMAKISDWLFKPQVLLGSNLGDAVGRETVRKIGGTLGDVVDGVNNLTGFKHRAENRFTKVTTAHATATQRIRGSAPEAVSDVFKTIDRAHNILASNKLTPMRARIASDAISAAKAEYRKQVPLPETDFFGKAKRFFTGNKEDKPLNEYIRASERKMRASQDVNLARDPGQTMKSRADNASIGQMLGKGVRYGFMAYEIYGGAKSVSTGFTTVRQLYRDVTGQKISWFGMVRKMISGDLPPLVKQARNQYIRGVLPGAGLLVGAAVGQHKIFNLLERRIPGNPILANFGAMGVFKVVEAANGYFAGKNEFAPVYAQLHAMEQAGHELDANAYLALIVAGSPKLQSLGGQYSANAQNIAVYLAEQNSSVAEVVQMLNKGDQVIADLSHLGKQVVDKYQKAEKSIMAEGAQRGEWASKMKMQNPGMQATKGGLFTDRVDASRNDATMQRA